MLVRAPAASSEGPTLVTIYETPSPNSSSYTYDIEEATRFPSESGPQVVVYILSKPVKASVMVPTPILTEEDAQALYARSKSESPSIEYEVGDYVSRKGYPDYKKNSFLSYVTSTSETEWSHSEENGKTYYSISMNKNAFGERAQFLGGPVYIDVPSTSSGLSKPSKNAPPKSYLVGVVGRSFSYDNSRPRADHVVEPVFGITDWITSVSHGLYKRQGSGGGMAGGRIGAIVAALGGDATRSGDVATDGSDKGDGEEALRGGSGCAVVAGPSPRQKPWEKPREGGRNGPPWGGMGGLLVAVASLFARGHRRIRGPRTQSE